MLVNILRETGALLDGHFLLSSGKHSDGYVQCAKLLMYPDRAEKGIKAIVDKLEDLDFDIIVGPAMGGIIVSYELARQTGKPGMFVERENGEMKIRRGFSIRKGQRVLIAEDVVTTGKSALEAIKAVEDHGAEVVGIACIVDRSNEKFKYPIFGGVRLNINTYEKGDCPLCKKNIPVIKPGSRDI